MTPGTSHPRQHAERAPATCALFVHPADEVRRYDQLVGNADRGAALFSALGLKRGDVVCIFMANRAAFMEAAWAAHDAGLYDVCIPTKATLSEAAHYVDDSSARLLLCDTATAVVGAQLFDERAALAPTLESWLVAGIDDTPDLAPSWEAALARTAPRTVEGKAGTHIYYSSGTTGRPKQIRPSLPDRPATEGDMFGAAASTMFGMGPDTVYLSPAPLYHTAPLAYSMAVQQLGGQVIVMQAFDAESLLMLIERHRVTHVQLVPTMFSRLLQLPPEVRRQYDLSSLRVAIHAAAPCPVDVKRKMIEWWGPILIEYYGGSEGNGMCLITSEEWLRKPGSVGRANWGTVHIGTESAAPARPGEKGLVYFEGAGNFEYYRDPGKTAASRHPVQTDWSTLGDIGYLDEDGYLFLTDRRDFVIISGGVNVYPQEIENRLAMHPSVADVAVVGGFHADLGEQVVSVVELIDAVVPCAALTDELTGWCRQALSPVKCPRVFVYENVPRSETGKLMKQKLKDRFSQNVPAD